VAWGSGTQVAGMPDLGNSVVAVAAAHGANYDLALKADGTVTGWGDPSTPASVPGTLSNVVQVSAGPAYALALQANGSIVAWGSDAPATQPELPAATQILAAPTSALALSGGQVTQWGTASTTAPPPPSDLSGVVQIASETVAFLALKSDHTVVSWGLMPDTNIPTDIQGRVTKVVGGGFSAAALLDDGTVRVWGALGSVPQPAALAGKTVDQLDMNGSIVVHTTDGEVFEWGGDASTAAVPSALSGAPVAQVVSGYVDSANTSGTAHSLAVVTTLRSTATPIISGTAKVGQTLGVDNATFNLTPSTVTVQWLADGDPITDATGDSLTLTADLVGKSITVAQTATLGDQTATATSNPVGPVAPSQATTTLRATANATTYGIPARVTVTANTTSATGPVQIKNGTRILGTANLTAGRATVTLPGTALTAGLHTLTAAYAGNVDNTAASTTVRLSVTKATAKLRVTVKPRKLTKAKLKRAKATITITAVGYTPTGKVTIRLKKKRITVSLVNGKAVINLKKIAKFAKKGKNKITIAYTGDTNTNPTTTRTTLKLSK
jgi:alpha-tubulin suppressor-like RCC1 family protein